ncbi:MAG TPA: YjzC family protein [Candidatus Limnocylindria bacterium]|nr:YjzC family protein [Candidatus Limnocylindria bacterium]
MREKLKPGDKAPASGQYLVIGRLGFSTGKEVTAVKGQPLPPTEDEGQTYVLKDATDNESGER